MTKEVMSSKNDVLIMTSKDIVNAAVEKYSKEYKALLVLDFSGADDAEKQEYIDAVKKTDLLTFEQIENTFSRGAVLIVIPFFTIQIAAEEYRKIKHARHFVTIWLDGKKYEVES